MGRKPTAQTYIQSNLGQHVALSVAAHLARTKLVSNPQQPFDPQHLTDTLDLVANALAKVATLYVRETKDDEPRPLTPAELDGAMVRRGATLLVLKDGRSLSSVTVKRRDLLQAIAILKAIGIPGLQPEAAAEPPAWQTVMERVAELEALLRPPLLKSNVEKANALTLRIARDARHGPVANIAMLLMSTVLAVTHGEETDPRDIDVALARLRAAVKEPDAENSPNP